jgi:hypothetical protein
LIKIDCPGEEKGCSPIFVALEGSNLLIDQIPSSLVETMNF